MEERTTHKECYVQCCDESLMIILDHVKKFDNSKMCKKINSYVVDVNTNCYKYCNALRHATPDVPSVENICHKTL